MEENVVFKQLFKSRGAAFNKNDATLIISNENLAKFCDRNERYY